MNTITNTASNNTILAIDLGKCEYVACILDQNSGAFHFTTFDTSRAELRKLIGKEQPGVVIIEACLLAGWVHDLIGDLRPLTTQGVHACLAWDLVSMLEVRLPSPGRSHCTRVSLVWAVVLAKC